MQLALAVIVLVVAIVAIARSSKAIALVATLSFIGGALAMQHESVSSANAAPTTNGPAEYVSSRACKSCHPAEHASWHRTFHRTMTQAATPSAVLAPFGDKITTRDGMVFAGGARVALLTGSHHEQVYWLDGDARLKLYPWVWMIEEKRFIPRRDAFIDPPDAPDHDVRWSSNCIACHTTAPRPHDGNDPDVAELGIACEACHGPGGEHVRKHSDPIERWMARADGKSDTSIVNPKKLPPDRASEVCGQCHAYAYPRDEEDWWKNGYTASFRPSQSMDRSRILLTLDVLKSSEGPRLEASSNSLYWSDGTMRVGGREYNAMIQSPCRGLTCTSCHTMHAGDPDDQLGPHTCDGCHAMPAEHTHHAKGSTGSECVACHMPRTSYALFTAIRSHRIESPRIDSPRLPACNLCHLDRTLAWTKEKLEAWYGKKQPAVADERVPAIVRWALRGDAAERVLAADALGRSEAVAISGARWEGRILAPLLRDPYAAVRFVAERSSKSVGGDIELVSDSVIADEVSHRDDRAVTIAE